MQWGKMILQLNGKKEGGSAPREDDWEEPDRHHPPGETQARLLKDPQRAREKPSGDIHDLNDRF